MATEAWEEEWADVDPIPQNEGPRPAVPIAYSPRFHKVMGYFRAALSLDERSDRSLRLTALAIELNAANYTAWHFRRLCLASLDADLEDELDMLEEMAEEHAKNYQLWHHRRWVAQTLGPQAAKRELAFSEAALTKGDSKNYHIWSHRQWVLRELGGATWQQEIAFCTRLLELDLWNNSAWNQRIFALKVLFPQQQGASKDMPSSNNLASMVPEEQLAAVLKKELEFTVSAVDKAPDNESSWAYLSGLCRLFGKKMKDESSILDLCARIIKSPRAEGQVLGSPADAAGPLVAPPGAAYALSHLLDLLQEGAHATTVAEAGGVSATQMPASQMSATQMSASQVGPAAVGVRLCEELQKVDKMRWNYWSMRKTLLSAAEGS